MRKRTAVEWLEQEFIALQNYCVNELGLFEKAKAMEKQQTIDFTNDYLNDDEYLTPEQYYTSTYGQ